MEVFFSGNDKFSDLEMGFIYLLVQNRQEVCKEYSFRTQNLAIQNISIFFLKYTLSLATKASSILTELHLMELSWWIFSRVFPDARHPRNSRGTHCWWQATSGGVLSKSDG